MTNGPYRLRSFSPEVYTFDVIREFTYPVGLGTFDFYAYPAKAFVTRVEHVRRSHAGRRPRPRSRSSSSATAASFASPLKRDTLRETLPIRPVARYVARRRGRQGGRGRRREPGRRRTLLPVSLPELPAGDYTVLYGVFLDGNTVNPAIGRIDFRTATDQRRVPERARGRVGENGDDLHHPGPQLAVLRLGAVPHRRRA